MMDQLCQKYLNNFTKLCVKPIFNKTRKNSAVIVETRFSPNLILVIKNFLYFFKDYNLIIFSSAEILTKLKDEIGGDFLGLALNSSTMSIDEYNIMLKSEKFWNSLPGENILIFQSDCIFFRYKDLSKIDYAMLGATSVSPDPEDFIINGGLSYRKKNIMIDIIKNKQNFDIINSSFYKKIKTEFNDDTRTKKLFAQEDVFFTLAIKQYYPNLFPSYYDCLDFAIESVGNPLKVLGLHGTDKNYFRKEILQQAIAFSEFYQ